MLRLSTIVFIVMYSLIKHNLTSNCQIKAFLSIPTGLFVTPQLQKMMLSDMEFAGDPIPINVPSPELPGVCVWQIDRRKLRSRSYHNP